MGTKDKSEAAIHFFKAVTYKENGQWGKSIDELNKVVEFNPNYAYAYYYRGIAHERQYGPRGDQHSQAISDYNKAKEINPKLTS